MRKLHARLPELRGLRGGSASVVLRETVDRNFLDPGFAAQLEELEPRRDAGGVAVLLRQTVRLRPAPVTVGNEPDVPGSTVSQERSSGVRTLPSSPEKALSATAVPRNQNPRKCRADSRTVSFSA